jgi:3-hydroxybutyryl-CoA dehydrogenase
MIHNPAPAMSPAATPAVTVGVVGAGAMGAGIALVAAAHGHAVVVADPSADALSRARATHEKYAAREVEKARRTREAADALLQRITYVQGTDASALGAMAACGVVIEAIVEQLEAKRSLLRVLEEVVSPQAVVASNTSSLSIAALAGACRHQGRVVGMHFFNPAQVMPLVEVIPAITTDAPVVAWVRALAVAWGKVTVVASDTPGFLVNRVARPFYGEALRLLEEGVADCATIDWAMRTVGEFRMGPFELMDFIGHDVNFAVTCSVFAGTFQDARYRPSIRQQRLVEAGWYGRKSGRGFYEHRSGVTAPEPHPDRSLAAAIVERVVAMLVNEAVDAVHLGIGSVLDVELAMTAGVNYPRGLLAWGDRIGPANVLACLDALYRETGDARYRASVRLRRAVQAGVALTDARAL